MVLFKHIFLVLFFLVCSIQVRGDERKFKYLTSEDGLANNVVWGITQDNEGFMWFATLDGLNRYDGYSFTNIKPTEVLDGYVTTNHVCTIYCDSKNRIWYTLFDGTLARYDSDTDRHKLFRYNSEKKDNFPPTIVNVIYEGENDTIWLGTQSGLLAYNENDGEFNFVRIGSFPEENRAIKCIAEDPDGNLFLGSDQGFYVRNENGTILKNTIDGTFVSELARSSVSSIYINNGESYFFSTERGDLFEWDCKKREIVKYDVLPAGKSKRIKKITQDNSGNIWIAYDGGITILSKSKRETTILSTTTNEHYGLNNSAICDLYHDNENRIWVATYGGGVNVYDPNSVEFTFSVFQHENNNPNSIINNTARAIAEDNKGNLWLGTEEGCSVLNRRTGDVTHLISKLNVASTLKNDVVLSICADSEGFLWLGNYMGGINLFNTTSGKNTRLHNIDGVYPKNRASNISAIKEDSKGHIWFGTWGDGLVILNKEKQEYQSYIDLDVNAIYQDSKDRIWLGLRNGYAFFPDPDVTDSFVTKKIPKGIGNVNSIFSICEGSDGCFWFGTQGGGLIKYDSNNESYKQYTTKDGLPSNIVYGVLNDSNGNLWLSTTKGIARFSPDEGKFRIYTQEDGLPGIGFNYGAYYKTRSGEMVFGCSKGFVLFHPDSLVRNINSPMVYFTDVKFSRSGEIEKKYPDSYKGTVLNDKEIIVEYGMGSFSVEFVALNYTQPEKTRYAFQLEEEDDNWIDLGTQRQIRFSGLAPGTYHLKVKASNANQEWNNNSSSLKMIILPPFWKTGWAYAFYILVASILLLLIRKVMTERIRLQHSIDFEKKEKNRIEELNQSKISFFTSISHEFRTPLMLIISPLEKIKSTKGLDEDLQLIYRNTNRLLRLINSLLDFRKIDRGNLSLNRGQIHVPNLAKSVIDCFQSMVLESKISIRYKCKLSNSQLIGDYVKLESVLYNILANSFKYSGDRDTIDFLIHDEESRLEDSISIQKGLKSLLQFGEYNSRKFIQIDIRDYGIGIKKEELEFVFERFYQSKNDINSVVIGSGIGMSVVKEFVLAHEGILKVYSEENKGTLFSILLPISNEEIVQDIFTEEQLYTQEASCNTGAISEKQEPKELVQNPNLPLLLLVEDDFEVQSFLKSGLSDEYNVISVSNGEEGLEMALQYNPMIIVSDIMMPKMNGYELCRNIKSDLNISHIPIVLISAKTDDDSKIKGMEYGADAYISKPFSIELLKANTKRILEQRVLLYEKIASGEKNNFDSRGLTASNQLFLSKNFRFIEQYIDDFGLNGEFLATQIGLSKSVYYKKLKSLTGKAPNELIIQQRMLKAKELMFKTDLNISEIALSIGFINPKHFSTRFKKEVGITPSQFKKEHTIT
ncbi:MAG: response regulator [Labilibaculum sp.]|nr:response regulator [Labilibaculum sp.]